MQWSRSAVGDQQAHIEREHPGESTAAAYQAVCSDLRSSSPAGAEWAADFM